MCSLLLKIALQPIINLLFFPYPQYPYVPLICYTYITSSEFLEREKYL